MTLRQKLHQFIHHPVVDTTIMIMILASVALLIVELSLHDPTIRHQVALIGDIFTGIFIAELSIRYYVARKKSRFFRQYWIDIIAVIPWVRSLRLLRLLRLLRIFRMGLLLTRRLRTISSVFSGAGGEALILMMIIAIVVLASAMGIRVLEGHGHPDFGSLEQGLWWAVMTLIAGEPVGGEAQTTAGKMLTLGVMLGGLTLFAIFTGVVSAVMVERLRNINVRTMEIEELRHHIVICGWNRSGKTILRELSKDPRHVRNGVVLVAEFEEEPDLGDHQIDPELLFVISGDFTQLSTLKECGVEYADRALLLADTTRERGGQDIDARTVLAAIAIERMNPEIFTSVELLNRENGAHLKIMGVEEIVVGDEYAGTLIAMNMRNRGISGLVNELMTVGEGNQFFKLEVPKTLVEHSVKEASQVLQDKHRAILVAIERTDAEGNRETFTNPPPEQTLQSNDQIVVIARKAPALRRRR